MEGLIFGILRYFPKIAVGCPCVMSFRIIGFHGSLRNGLIVIQFGDRYIYVKNNEIFHLESLKGDFVRCIDLTVLYRSSSPKMYGNIFGKLSSDHNNVY